VAIGRFTVQLNTSVRQPFFSIGPSSTGLGCPSAFNFIEEGLHPVMQA